jgi:DNA-binding transcriptional LysR family regulator
VELRQLRHFLAVVECGSLGDAARKVGMSQPALTKSIQALERSLDAPLFARSSSGMSPNAFGNALVLRARTIANEAARAHNEIGELKGVQRGTVKIGSTSMFMHAALPSAIVRFQRSHPDVEVSVTEGVLNALLPALAAGEYDFVLCSLSSRLNALQEFERRILMPKRRASIVTAAGNPIVSRRRLAAKDLVDGPWLLPGPTTQSRTKLNNLFAKAGLPPPQASVVYSSITLAKAILREGDYITFMSEVVVRDELKSGLVRRVNVPDLTLEDEAGVLLRRGVPLMPAADALLNEIASMCREIRV